MKTDGETGIAFDTAYKTLNPAQKKAVDTIEGPVMVIAGPGTGKTQILTLRIANILKQTDTAPDSILALTFTESGAKAMRQRLHRYIGSRSYKVSIYTFHGFAGRLIQDFPDTFPRLLGGRVANDIDKITTITDILEAGTFKKLRPLGNPQYYINPLISIIQKMKQEYVTPDQLATIISSQEEQLKGIEKIHQKGAHKGKVRSEYTKLEGVIEKNYELLEVYRLYEASLREKKLYDFDDMIGEVVNALQTDEDFLRSIQEQYQYVLADEHQDVNGSQNKILETLCNFHKQPNIFVVGDEKQAIYRFQGASLENFLYFEDLFKDTTTISLTDNYRSGQSVLDAAHSLVKVEEGPLKDLRVPLTAASAIKAEVVRCDFSHQTVEDNWITEEVKTLLESSVPAAEIAIIVRTNKEVSHLAGLLRKVGIDVTASADGDILAHPITETVRSLMDFVISDGDESALFSILHGSFWGLSAEDVVRIMHARSYSLSLVSILSDKKLLHDIGVKDCESANKIISVLETARARDGVEPPHRVLEYLMEESGFLDHVMAHDPVEGVRVLRRLYDEVEALVVQNEASTLRDVVRELGLRQTYGLSLNAPYISTNDQAVQVMTAHKSKGLEFKAVFIPHLHDKAWGGSRRPDLFTVPLTRSGKIDKEATVDDERRLLYVAMTRAKEKLFLSNAATNTEGKELIPSRLFGDIEPDLLKAKSTDEIESSFDLAETLKVIEHKATLNTAWLQTVLSERGLSATSLNNYLKNPWDFLYRNVLRIPEVQPAHMQFGTAVHNTLQRITKHNTEQKALPSDTQIKSWLEVELGRLPIGVEEYTRLHEKGLTTLFTYLTHLEKTLPVRTLEEKKIRVLLPTGIENLPELPLTGTLDRIDLSEDGRALRVVDYKTGKAKSRNVIEGKTANSDGGYKRQLVFYSLILSLYDDSLLKCNEGVLSFVEATEKGEIKEESFTVTEDEIESLREEIISAVKNIISGNAFNSPEILEESEYSHLAKQLILLT